MKVIVACEYSGIVRDAFIAKGHDATSCDILPTESPGPHIQGDIRDVDLSQYDLMIAHPPCTHLAVSGARWFKNKPELQKVGLELVQYLLDAPVPRIALENPVGIISSRIRKPDQYIQPYEYGHPTAKKTGLWLKNLPLLQPTNIVQQEFGVTKSGRRYDKWWLWTSSLPPSQRGHERSKTFSGIAEAMAEQWGSLEPTQ